MLATGSWSRKGGRVERLMDWVCYTRKMGLLGARCEVSLVYMRARKEETRKGREKLVEREMTKEGEGERGKRRTDQNIRDGRNGQGGG